MDKQYSSNANKFYAICKLSKLITSSLNYKEVLNLILETSMSLFKADGGSIMLFNRDKELEVVAAKGLDTDKIGLIKVKKGEGISGKVAETGAPLLLIGKAKPEDFVKLVQREETITSSCILPLKVKEEIIGVLNIRSDREKLIYTREDLEFLNMLADYAAIAIENARLYELEKKRLEEITAERQKILTILNSLNDGIMVLNKDNIITMVNPVLCKFFEKPVEYFQEKPLEVAFSIDKLIKFINNPTHKSLIIKGRSVEYLEVNVSPVYFVEGKVLGKVVSFHDITAAKKLEQLREEFVSLISHELKTPLTSIMGFASLLSSKNNKLSEEQKKDFILIIKTESERLLNLINDLLDISRLEAGKYKFKKELIEVKSLLVKAIELFKYQSDKHLFKLDTPPSFIFILGDENMLFQVITNLLSNAVKYSPAGGEIEVKLEEEDQKIKISVKDQGIGIAREEIPFLFQRFYRAKISERTKIPGTGLGLANVKYIIEAHGGEIMVNSKEGEGSCFYFTLPKGVDN